MPRFGKAAVLSTVLAASFAGANVARAQANNAAAMTAMTDACTVQEGTPSAVAIAVIQITNYFNASGDDLKKQALRAGMKGLTNPVDKNPANSVGKAWELGRILSLWIGFDDQPVVASRGSLGMQASDAGYKVIGMFEGGDTASKIDISAWIDSAYKRVSDSIPACAPLVDTWRQGAGWYRLINQALQQVNDSHFDSATVTVSQAGRIFDKNPYIWLVRGQIADGQNDTKTAIVNYEHGIEETKRDTIFDPVRRQIYREIGKNALDAADAAKAPADKAWFLGKADTAFHNLAKEPGVDGTEIARQGIAAVAIQRGDTAAIKNAYVPIMNDTSSDFEHLRNCGYAADAAKQYADAIHCFRMAVAKNPWHRDGLYNLSIELAQRAIQLNAADTAGLARPYLDRLMQIDPSNLDNFVVGQQIYALVQRSAVAKANRYNDSANAHLKASDALKHTAFADSASKWEDSAKVFATKSLEFTEKRDSVTTSVRFSEWTPKDGSVTVGGTLSNRTKDAKTVTMTIEFLDKDGKVVATGQSQPTKLEAQGTAGASQTFTITAAGAGIMAFRYAALK